MDLYFAYLEHLQLSGLADRLDAVDKRLATAILVSCMDCSPEKFYQLNPSTFAPDRLFSKILRLSYIFNKLITL